MLYEALTARFYDESQGYGRGQFAELWEPIAFSRYMDPGLYEGREHLDFEVSAEDCVACHESVTPGWVHAWGRSTHADLDALRALPSPRKQASSRRTHPYPICPP